MDRQRDHHRERCRSWKLRKCTAGRPGTGMLHSSVPRSTLSGSLSKLIKACSTSNLVMVYMSGSSLGVPTTRRSCSAVTLGERIRSGRSRGPRHECAVARLVSRRLYKTSINGS
ncbi:hypothetical protein OG21DRAFT_622040 [Imleria badia]|nr:hypothetical protein OG21DRAFT_622040 [Imleria badia]